MDSEVLFIYDGKCPFCNHFAELIELRKSVPYLRIQNGRYNLKQLEILFNQGYDLDKGAIILNNKEILHGAEAIHWICFY